MNNYDNIDYNGKYTITLKELKKQNIDIFEGITPDMFYDPSHFEDFKIKFNRHYRNYEIGQDEAEEFIEELKDTLAINYPKYKHYFETEKQAKTLRWWFNKDYDVEHNRTLNTTDSSSNHNESRSNNINRYIGKIQDEGNSVSKFLDTAQGRIENLDDGWMTNATKDNNSNTTNSSGNNESNGTNESDSTNKRQGQDIETIRNKEYGNIGTTSSGDLVKSWLEDGYFNIDKMIIKDCAELFMLIFN